MYSSQSWEMPIGLFGKHPYFRWWRIKMIIHTLLPSTSSYYTSQHTGYVNTPSSGPSVPDAITDTLDLSSGARNLPATFNELSPLEQTQYLENLARLLQAGIVGVETVEVNGAPYKSFASTRVADPRIAHAAPYRRPI